MSRRRWDRRKGNPWDIDQSDDPNIAIYGEKARPLPLDGKLPTSKDVDLAVEFQLENTEAGYQDQQKSAVKSVAEEVEAVWVKLVPDVPLKVRKNIVKSLSDLRVKRSLFLKIRKTPDKCPNYLGNLLESIRTNGDKLFNIQQTRYNKTEKSSTSLPKLRQNDILFLQDQDTDRQLRRAFPQAPPLPADPDPSVSSTSQTHKGREAFKVLEEMFGERTLPTHY